MEEFFKFKLFCPGIPHELLAQMKRIPKIPGEMTVSSGTMGPPDVPDNRKILAVRQHNNDNVGNMIRHNEQNINYQQ